MVTLRPSKFYGSLQIKGLHEAFTALQEFASVRLGGSTASQTRRGASESASEALQALQERLNQRSVKAFLAASQRDLETLDRSLGVRPDLSGASAGPGLKSKAPQPHKTKRVTASSAPASSLTFDQLMENGQLLSGPEFEERLGCRKQAVSQAVKARRYFYVEVGGRRAYPAFFVDPRYNRRDLEAISKLLGDISGGSKYLFFTTPKGSLALAADPTSKANGVARTPLEALAAGDLARVKRTAQGYAQA
jgi:Ca2+-binding RTX toxin-like protein